MKDLGRDHSDFDRDALDMSRIEADVEGHLEILPDGTEALEFGDASGIAEFGHRQGQNDRGFQGTCGLCSCEGILRQFGLDVAENDIVEYAVENELCWTSPYPEWLLPMKENCGGTTVQDQIDILEGHGVPAHAEFSESLEDLAAKMEAGHGVIAEVNAGVLWDNANYVGSGAANHAIVITAVDRHPETGEILGFKINDTGVPNLNHFVSAETMREAWLEAGGMMVATDGVRPTSNV